MVGTSSVLGAGEGMGSAGRPSCEDRAPKLARVGVVESSIRDEGCGSEVLFGRGVVGGVTSLLWLRFREGGGSICGSMGGRGGDPKGIADRGGDDGVVERGWRGVRRKW